MLNKEFYTEFGKVLYAMSMADGEVQEEEVVAIKKLIKEELEPLEPLTDEFGSDLSAYAWFSFENEVEIEDDVDIAYGSFIDHIKYHHIKIDNKTFTVLSNILKKVARAYGRFTKDEQEVFDNFVEKMKSVS